MSAIRNIKVFLRYKGTAYHGFQTQINAVAIQDIIEERLSSMVSAPVRINGCSRTDSGVHANLYCFSAEIEHSIPCENIVRGMNSILPPDIALISCEDAPADFHARYSCKGKEYLYMIDNSRQRNPFLCDTALHYPYPLDEVFLNAAAQHFVGTHDFRSFCGTNNMKENCVRTIEYFSVARENDIVKMLVKGDGFLYNMVRIMVGTLIFVNEGKFSADDIPAIIEARDRRRAGKTAAACGLYLNRIFY